MKGLERGAFNNKIAKKRPLKHICLKYIHTPYLIETFHLILFLNLVFDLDPSYCFPSSVNLQQDFDQVAFLEANSQVAFLDQQGIPFK